MAPSPPTILCVDDEPNVLRSLRRELAGAGYQVETETDPHAALARLESSRFAVVISDYRMPQLTGDEVLHRVGSASPDTYRILLTGQADLNAVAAAINKGGLQRYLTKPWDEEELLQAVAQGAERYNLLRQNQRLLQLLKKRNRSLQDLNDQLEERVQARSRQLEQAYAELVNKEKLAALGRMAAGVVHEVLNPLSVVSGRLHMALRQQDLPDKSRRSLEVAGQQTQRAAAILENLRDVSKQRPPQPSTLPVRALITQSLEALEAEFARRGIEVDLDCPDGLPPLQADADQLAQVLLNLLKNAAEAMSEGGHIRVGAACPTPALLVVSIYDSGSGIAPENLDRLFEPFFTTKEQGTGLGLSICQGIAEIHGGRIEASNRPEGGALFQLSLPLEASA